MKWGLTSLFCRFEATAAASLLVAAGASFADRPNIIFILADDVGTEAIEGPHWDNALNCHTPNLAQWAANGRSFTSARSYPNCSPTRAALMSGREALRTGVVGVIWPETTPSIRQALSLQPQETTLAEALRAESYNTILIDKWHLGWDQGVGILPQEQGFDVFYHYEDTLLLDDPLEVGDEHISLSVDQAVDAVLHRARPDDPYALFFWSIDAHQREDPSGREPRPWWKTDERLLPSGERYYDNDTDRNRYRAVVEALDTELLRLLQELDVVDSRGRYRESSNTVVFFMGDNGTPPPVSVHGQRAKGSLYEPGIRVPLFVFGEDVSHDGRAEDRPVSASDLFETIADVADVSLGARGDAPRDSRSFADRIGYSPTGPARTLSMSFDGQPDDPSRSRVALTNGRYKLIARGGGPALAPLSTDEFYDLDADPDERDNLVRSGMNGSERAEYLAMRDQLVDYWPCAMSERLSTQVDIPVKDVMWIDEENNRGTSTLTLGTYHPEQSDARESRVLIKFHIERLESLLPQGKSVDDIISAQIAFGFARESTEPDETDTGVIRIYPMTGSWSSSGQTSWSDINEAFDSQTELGLVDLPPHIIPNPPGSKQFGVPLTLGTPLSLGRSEALVNQVRSWHAGPSSNDGVVLIADVVPGLHGDQRVFLMNIAAIRVTLR
ncbi:MAG: sulfatase-like hydrolase/transferase [Phycisphaerales bacterium]|nr:sulfatase-like hydrolase/transferase [Phycisphaerales bacterium]